MLRGLGVLILICGSIGYGFSYSYGKKNVIKEIGDFLYFFQLLESEVSYHKEPIPEAVYHVGRRMNGGVGQLVCHISELMYSEKNGFFAEYWIQGLKKYWENSFFSKEEKRMIEEFANYTGCKDETLQISLLSEYRERLGEYRKQKVEELKGKQKVVMGVSAVSGLVLTILLL